MKFRASVIADVVDGELVGPDVEVEGANMDSRELRAGQLFVPVVGERDGHDFIDAARANGAAAYLTARDPQGGTAVVVRAPEVALAKLGAAARDRLGQRVVGVTGSVGKTSTKDQAAAVLRRRYRTHASERSFNNELGVPLTLVNAPDDTDVTVVEMGARGRGHIAELCAVARPTVGVVTSVDLVHTELFGDLAAVAAAKRELTDSLPASGTAVLNADNPHVAAMADGAAAAVLRYGTDRADVRAEQVRIGRDLRPSFRLCTPWGDIDVELAARGAHNVHNALAAAAVGLVVGVDLREVAAGLGEATMSPWRMEMTVAPSGAIVLNDAYNAGPASMEAALRALAHLDAERRVAVLGPMAELGEHSLDAHRRIAELARELGVEVVSVGTPAYGATDVVDVEGALARLPELGPDVAVLIKGSRVAGLERLAARLLQS